MRAHSFLITFLCFVFCGFAQPIPRFKPSGEIAGKKIHARIRPDIFKEQPWLATRVPSKKIALYKDIHYFTMEGASFQLTRIDASAMQLQGHGNAALMGIEKSDGTIFYDHHVLPFKPEVRTRWVAHGAASLQRVAFDKIGTVRETTMEDHLVPATNWKWEDHTDSVYDIPVYDHCIFPLNDNKTIIFYQVSTGDETAYYLQNASYLLSSDGEGMNYFLLDADCNGTYTDPEDLILFNSWNPFAKESAYRPLQLLQENTWYPVSYLNNELFAQLAFTNGKLEITNLNDGEWNAALVTATLKKIPKHARLFVNGNEYPVKKGTNRLDMEPGYHRIRIHKEGATDVEATLKLVASQKNNELTYKKTQAAAAVVIKNLFAPSYFITVTGKNGYERTYRNMPAFSVPEGNYTVEISINGLSLKRTVTLTKKETYRWDVEEELRKMVK